MRISFIAAFFLISISAGCTRQIKPATMLRDRAMDSVQSYLTKNLNDPGSYQPIRFANFKAQKDVVIGGYNYKGEGFTIQHSYRAKNGFGALVLFNQKFFLDDKLQVGEVQDLAE